MDQHWDELVKHFCNVSDGLGMPIDDEIFETVIALNALGVTTTMSCAGHITRDEGDVRYPWVDFCATNDEVRRLEKETEELRMKIKKRTKKLKHQQAEGTASDKVHILDEESSATWQAYHSLYRQERKLQVPLRLQVVGYLIRFYADRPVPYDRRLTLNLLGTTTRLESQGAADFNICEPREVQLQKLTEYRDEMRAFTDFLKGIYAEQKVDNEQEGDSEQKVDLVEL